MRIHLCGVRGSSPSPGAEYLRYGGHTSCVAVAHDGEAPSLLLDAGTGLRVASGLMGEEPFVGAILLTHLHWDHVQGLPFFPAGFREGASATVFLPAQGDAEAVLEGLMSPPYFPITPRQLGTGWTFESLEIGVRVIEGFSVAALEIPHAGGRTYGYRVSDETASLAFLTDHCPIKLGAGPEGLGPYHDAALSLATGCDVLIHDAQYIDTELPARAQFGHSACSYAVGLAAATGVKEVVLFHHDPYRSDSALDAIMSGLDHRGLSVRVAVQGAVIDC